MHFAGSVCWGLLFLFFFFFTCYLFFNLLVVWLACQLYSVSFFKAAFSRASVLVRHSETLRRRHGVVDEESHKRIYEPERGNETGPLWPPRPAWTSRKHWHCVAWIFSMNVCLAVGHCYPEHHGHRFTHKPSHCPSATLTDITRKKKNNINDYRDNSIESKLKG